MSTDGPPAFPPMPGSEPLIRGGTGWTSCPVRTRSAPADAEPARGSVHPTGWPPHHPARGPLRFEDTTFRAKDDPALRLAIHTLVQGVIACG